MNRTLTHTFSLLNVSQEGVNFPKKRVSLNLTHLLSHLVRDRNGGFIIESSCKYPIHSFQRYFILPLKTDSDYELPRHLIKLFE